MIHLKLMNKITDTFQKIDKKIQIFIYRWLIMRSECVFVISCTCLMIQLVEAVLIQDNEQPQNINQVIQNKRVIMILIAMVWNFISFIARRFFHLSSRQSSLMDVFLSLISLEIYLLRPCRQKAFALISHVVLSQHIFYINRYYNFHLLAIITICYTLCRLIIYNPDWQNENIMISLEAICYQFFGFSISLRVKSEEEKENKCLNKFKVDKDEEYQQQDKKCFELSKITQIINIEGRHSQHYNDHIQSKQIFLINKQKIQQDKNICEQKNNLTILEKSIPPKIIKNSSINKLIKQDQYVCMQTEILKNVSSGIIIFNKEVEIVFENKMVSQFFQNTDNIKESILNYSLSNLENNYLYKKQNISEFKGNFKRKNNLNLNKPTKYVRKSNSLHDNLPFVRSQQTQEPFWNSKEYLEQTQKHIFKEIKKQPKFNQKDILYLNVNSSESCKQSKDQPINFEDNFQAIQQNNIPLYLQKNGYSSLNNYESYKLQTNVINQDNSQKQYNKRHKKHYKENDVSQLENNDNTFCKEQMKDETVKYQLKLNESNLSNQIYSYSLDDEEINLTQEVKIKKNQDLFSDSVKLHQISFQTDIQQKCKSQFKKLSILQQPFNKKIAVQQDKLQNHPKYDFKLKKNIISGDQYLMEVLSRQQFSINDVLKVLLNQNYFHSRLNTAKSERQIQTPQSLRTRLEMNKKFPSMLKGANIGMEDNIGTGIPSRKNFEINCNKITIRTGNQLNRIQVTISSFIREIRKQKDLWQNQRKNKMHQVSTEGKQDKKILNCSFGSPKEHYRIQRDLQDIQQEPLVIIEFIDINDIVKEGQSEELTEFKNRMLSSLSHELRTPLNCSIQMLEMMNQCETISKETKRMFIKPALNSNELLLNMVNDILDLAQINKGELNMQFKPFKIRRVLQECVGLFALQSAQKNIPIELHIDQQMPRFVHSDCTRFRQIVLNLLSNAIKFSQKGFITINADYLAIINTSTDSKEEKKNIIKISISDMGCGISREVGNLIFQGFSTEQPLRNIFKAKTTTNQTYFQEAPQCFQKTGKQSKNLSASCLKYSPLSLQPGSALPQINTCGAGLGLSIANNLAKGLGANRGIEFTSEVEKGSTFNFFVIDQSKTSRGCKMSQYNIFNIQFTDWRVLSMDSKDISLPNSTSQTFQDSQMPSLHTIKISQQRQDSFIQNLDVFSVKKMAKKNSNQSLSQKIIPAQNIELQLDTYINDKRYFNKQDMHLLQKKERNDGNGTCSGDNDSCNVTSYQTLAYSHLQNTNNFEKVKKESDFYMSSYQLSESNVCLTNTNHKNNLDLNLKQFHKDQGLQKKQQRSQNNYRHHSVGYNIYNQSNFDQVQQSNPLYSSSKLIKHPLSSQIIPHLQTQLSVFSKCMVYRIKDKTVDNLFQSLQSFLDCNFIRSSSKQLRNKNFSSTQPFLQRSSANNINLTNSLITNSASSQINTPNTSHFLNLQQQQQIQSTSKHFQKSQVYNCQWINEEDCQIGSETSVNDHLREKNNDLDHKKQRQNQNEVISDKQQMFVYISENANLGAQIASEPIAVGSQIQPNLFQSVSDNFIKECDTPLHYLKEGKISDKKKLIIFNESLACSCSKILIVDDNDFNLYALELRLNLYKFNIDKANSGIMGLNIIKEKFESQKCCKKYSLIFMDIDMPVKNGYETTQDILQYFDSHFTPPPTISACTAFVSESEKLRAKQSGMKYYLTKPINSALIENILIKNFLK